MIDSSKVKIDKMLSELTHDEIVMICCTSYSCRECPLCKYDVHFCLEKYKNLRKVYDERIEVVLDVVRGA